MPEAFERCVRNGGRVRTKSLGGGQYMRICFLNGKSYPGEVKRSKDDEGRNAAKREAKRRFDKMDGKK